MTALAPISGVCITLSADDLAGAKALGDRRLSEARRMGLQNKYAAGAENERAIHAFGAAGEYAVARFLGVAIPATVNTFHAPDLLDDIQVRTRRKPHYELIVRTDDEDDHRYVLVYADPPTFWVRGFMYGHAAKRRDWQRDYGGFGSAYFVPTSHLTHPQWLRPATENEAAMLQLSLDILW